MTRHYFAIALLSVFAALSMGFTVDDPELKNGDDQIVLPAFEPESAFDGADSCSSTLLGDEWVTSAPAQPPNIAQAASSCISAHLACTEDCQVLVGAARGACLRHCRAERDECLGN